MPGADHRVAGPSSGSGKSTKPRTPPYGMIERGLDSRYEANMNPHSIGAILKSGKTPSLYSFIANIMQSYGAALDGKPLNQGSEAEERADKGVEGEVEDGKSTE
jgi:hypothetical protein